MATRKMTAREMRTVETVANDFDDWASRRTEGTGDIALGVMVSLFQQLLSNRTESEALTIVACALDAAKNPANASVDPFAARGSS